MSQAQRRAAVEAHVKKSHAAMSVFDAAFERLRERLEAAADEGTSTTAAHIVEKLEDEAKHESRKLHRLHKEAQEWEQGLGGKSGSGSRRAVGVELRTAACCSSSATASTLCCVHAQ